MDLRNICCETERQMALGQNRDLILTTIYIQVISPGNFIPAFDTFVPRLEHDPGLAIPYGYKRRHGDNIALT
jgi:hypothetical protein